MQDKLKIIAPDRKTAEKTSQLKKQLSRQLHESVDINAWCDSIIATNKALDNLVAIEPELAFIGVGEERLNYDFSSRQAIIEGLNFCGCGMADEALSFIKKGLLHISQRRDADNSDSISQDELAVFGSAGAATFFYYWADRERLIDHGSSVPGWLDDKGEYLLAKLDDLGY